MKVDLVYPSSVTRSENYSSEPPLGPIALYSSLLPEWKSKVRFLDSTLLDHKEILDAIAERRPEIVAFSCTTFNYGNALKLATFVKNYGGIVIMGGIHITYMRDRILSKMTIGERPIDYLVTGQAECSFQPLLNSIVGLGSVDEVPNLSFVRDGKIIVNQTNQRRNGQDPLQSPLSFDQIDFGEYSERFQRIGNLKSVRIAGTMFTQRGCAYAGSKKCRFCSIEQINPRRPKELIEKDIMNLIERHGVDHIRISDGDFTLNKKHMAVVADAADQAAQTTGIRPTFYCFSRADEIDIDRIQLLKRLNVVSVFIGYESGSDQMLASMHKFTTRQQNLESTVLLRDAGIEVVCAGMVLGAEGENKETLAETISFAEELKLIGNTRSLVATPLIPLPGSPAFTDLLERLRFSEPTKFSELSRADDFDIEELVTLWNREMTNVSLRTLDDSAQYISGLFPVGIRFLTMPVA